MISSRRPPTVLAVRLLAGLGDVVLQGQPLGSRQLWVIGHDQDPLGACDSLGYPEGLDTLQAGTRTGEEPGVGVRDRRQFGMFLVLDRTDELEFQLVQQAEIGGRVVPLVEDQRRFGDGTLLARQFAEELMESPEHLRELPGVAIAWVDVVNNGN